MSSQPPTRKSAPCRLEAALFDFDGLILDTETPEVVAWTAVFADHGREFLEAHWIAALGRGPEQGMGRHASRLAAELGRPGAVESIQSSFETRRLALIGRETVRPGVVERLDEAAALGLRVAAVSSSPRVWVDGNLRRLGLRERFELLVCADDVARTKPHPELYLLALRLLGVAADRAVALEDSPNGVAAAREAGILVVAAPNALTAKLDLSAADRVVVSLADFTFAELDLGPPEAEGADRATVN